MRIVPKQIVAAMGLAGLNQDELASLAGIGRNTISRILNEQTTPSDDTLRLIKSALEQKGIEFIGNIGVQWAQHQVRTLSGVDGLKAFFDDVRVTVQGSDKEVIICGIDEKYLEDKLGDFIPYQRNEMAKISHLRMRCLIEENDFELGASDYCKYRWQAKANFSNVPFYIYGDKLAIIVTSAPEDPLILLIHNRAITEAYRKQFEAMWILAKEPTIKEST